MSKTKDITPLNDKGESHGLCESYLFGELWYRIFFQNGKGVGYGIENNPYTGKLEVKRYDI